ncbi:hypothetical protein [Thalassotalea aquiviva]|uniref:hypothetical protein n=1 Tax=Thalassotalea aquiviva TaxID=3242415 RepID=UPI00352A524F
MSKSEHSNSRRSFILLLAAFIIPVVLAKFALTQQWFNYGVTNLGELIETPLTLADVGIEAPKTKQWLVIYSLPQECNKRCQHTLLGVQNSYFALGRETPRVTPIALTHSSVNLEQIKQLDARHWQVISAPAHVATELSSSKVYIADPLGNIIISYQQPISENEVPSFGKAMLSDLKKLLKYSRIG